MPKPGNPTDFTTFLTWEELVEILSYDQATGDFRWTKSDRLGWVGRRAGAIDKNQGYRRIEIKGRSFYSSRLAFFYMKRCWPTHLIDHINGDRSDDRWINLREATRQQNGFNRRARKDSKSGINGVYRQGNRWIARCRIGNVRHNLGSFATIDEATRARTAFEATNLGDYSHQAQLSARDPALALIRDASLSESRKNCISQKIPRRGIAADFGSTLTQDIVMRLLSYDPTTGEFSWKSNELSPIRIKVGQKTAITVPGEYADIQILGRKFRAHRIAWLYMTGAWPRGDIDHINRRKQDNRWENLREVTRSQNAYNQHFARLSKSGVRGVHPIDNGKWRAVARKHGKQISLGTFDVLEEAAKARHDYMRYLDDECQISPSQYRGVP